MELETSRLVIRPHSPDDFEDYYAYIMEPELQHMLGLNGVTGRETAWETYQWLMDNVEFLAVIQKEPGRAIGHICVHPAYARLSEDPSFREKPGCSLSFAMAVWARRKGYMEEALSAVIDELFACGRADYIDCEYTAFNAASRALQEKLGFSVWGKEAVDGVDLIINVLKRKEWELRKNGGAYAY